MHAHEIFDSTTALPLGPHDGHTGLTRVVFCNEHMPADPHWQVRSANGDLFHGSQAPH